METSTREILVLVVGSGGAIGGIVSLLMFVVARFDKRKDQQDVTSNTVLSAYQAIVDERNHEIERLKSEIKEYELSDTLSRPKVAKIFVQIRLIWAAFGRLNLMILTQEETNIIAEKFDIIKNAVKEIEDIVSQ